MLKTTPQQALFDSIYTQLLGYGIDVIDFKELNSQLTYPFFVLRDVEANKSKYTMESVGGELTVIIDLWNYAEDRGQHDSIVGATEWMLTGIESVEGYQLMIDDINIKTLNDVENSDRQLLHTVIIAIYKLF
ncbi:TPA: hypothetical protein O4746_000855 [Staphylococcus aureus]|uniref:DUF3168 domain-containing protein n=1 Tax=Staphylococcus aureus TaxID=1280 RepID=A0AAW4Y9K5_STAAU|nr:hypothetical protein [Staphylococcus aureus]MBE7573832.1 hypothetical protein [Staphylococcus aureus]MBE7576539.1 hypothetical protein [Staphylococcus aureus]MBE7581910.1 hypothetical protein [Staphylococcus aureus]MBE7587647.1 hypothetical protein [Staphylococcus aureus]MBE7590504.1 hypothetical protein [Staphylococcus aureus]